MKLVRVVSSLAVAIVLVALTATPAAASTPVSPPAYNTPFLTDGQLRDYNSMNAAAIKSFLTSKGSYFKVTVKDVDGSTLDMSQVIYSAAQTYHVSPKVLLTTMQKESSSVYNTTRPSDYVMRNLMWCGGSTARYQIICAASTFNNAQSVMDGGGNVNGWRRGVAKLTQDGVLVTPATNAVAGQFSYTPYAGIQWGGKVPGGVYLFYQCWRGFGF
ncbi:MAG: hypothetical protein ABSD56_15725 [Bryobacteraceae bacterium]